MGCVSRDSVCVRADDAMQAQLTDAALDGLGSGGSTSHVDVLEENLKRQVCVSVCVSVYVSVSVFVSLSVSVRLCACVFICVRARVCM